MAKKRSLPTQSNTLLSFFSKGSPSTSSSSSPKPAKKKVKTEGSSVNHPVCLLDSSDDEDVVLLQKPADTKGKGKAKQEIIDLPDSSQEHVKLKRGKSKKEEVEDEDEVQLQVDQDLPPQDEEDGILGADEFDALMDSVGAQIGASRTSCQKWEDEHQHQPLASTSVLKPPPVPSSLLPSAVRTSPSSIAGPSNPTRGRLSIPPKSADLPQVIDLDEDEPNDEQDEFGFGDFDGDGGWNPEDDEQGEQDDPGDEDLEDGLGEREEDEFDEGFRGYADEVMIADDDEDEEGLHLASPPKPFRSISSFKHVLARPPSPPPRPPPKRDAFAILMSKDKQHEDELWKDVEEDQSIKRGGKVIPHGERRKAPFFKVLTGMPIAVDAFRYGAVPLVTTYLLSHAHSDHYTNLSKAWKNGPIYCSQTTANLIIRNLKVDPKWVKVLPYDIPTVLPDTGGVVCTMISANHCPGSSIFLFEGKRTVHAGDSPYPPKFIGSKRIWRYLHCGDFRASPQMVLHPAIKEAALDEIYLDTTYLNPQYCFPPQPVVISSVAELTYSIVRGGHLPHQPSTAKAGGGVSGWLRKSENEEDKEERERKERIKGERTLIVVGTYSVGKERLAKGIAQRLGTKIYAEPRKRVYIDAQTDDPALTALMTLRSSESQVHLIPLSDICHEGLSNYLERYHLSYDRILGYRPTGWTFTPTKGTSTNPEIKALITRDQATAFDARELMPTRGSSETVVMFGVPYSEHSSFFELTCFALSVPGEPRMIPTVNVSTKKSRDKMEVWIKKWAAEKKKRTSTNQTSVVQYRDLEYW